MSKILIHTLVFSPDCVSTAYLYNDIALKFKEAGHEVVVLTTSPNYNILESEIKKQPLKKKCFGLYSVSNFNGIKVMHVAQKKFKNTFLRLLSFLYWHSVSFIIGLTERNIDIILSPSPPLTLGMINIILGKIKKAKTIYNVQEIYPDLIIQNGMKSKLAISFLKWMEKYIYNNSNVVTTIDQIFYNTISPRFKDKSKLHIIPNFVDTELYRPLNSNELTLDKNLFPNTPNLKLMYAGNIGLAQDWQIFINLAFELKDEPIEFFVIGEGILKNFLQKNIAEKNLQNVHILPYQPRELMPQLLAYSDLQFIFMTPETEDQGFPSKIYTILACAKPTLVCSGEETPIINFLSDKNCSYLVTEKDEKLKIEQIKKFLKSVKRSELEEMGKNGHKHLSGNYSKKIITEKYVNLVETLTKEKLS
ncbi:MAG: glycosyltransferase family 4 protein [Bacteroidales bacterium]|nr:glycosyltransferase family 4 protein [Bacteroidales bacterium]